MGFLKPPGLGHFEAELRAKQALVENAGKLPSELREEIAAKVRSDPWAGFDDKKVRVDIGGSAFDKLDEMPTWNQQNFAQLKGLAELKDSPQLHMSSLFNPVDFS